MDTKKITEGAMMLALIGVLLLVSRIVAGFLDFFICLPVLVYTVKYGWKQGLILFISAIIVSSFISDISTICFLISYMVGGYMYGVGIYKRWNHTYVLTLVCSSICVFTTISSVVLVSFFGYNMEEDLMMIQDFVSSFSNHQFVLTTHMMYMMLMMAIVLLSVLETICMDILGYYVLYRLHLPCQKMKPIILFSLPKWIFYVNLFIWVLYFMENVLKLRHEFMDIVMMLYLGSYIMMVLFGMVVVAWYCAKHHSRIWMVLAWIGLFIPFVRHILAYIGLIDGLLDIRKVRYRKS